MWRHCTLVTSYAVPVHLVSPHSCAELLGSLWWCPGPGLLPGIRVAVLSLQDLGVTKVGHMKRILCGIKELSRSPPATEA